MVTDIILTIIFLIPRVLFTAWNLLFSFFISLPIISFLVGQMVLVLKFLDFACPAATPCSSAIISFLLNFLLIFGAVYGVKIFIKLINLIPGIKADTNHTSGGYTPGDPSGDWWK